MNAGRELDELVAEKVMGWGKSCGGALFLPGRDGSRITHYAAVPHYSTSIGAAWEAVREVQQQHHGWRFSLLGGDVTMGYVNDSPSEGVDESSRHAFGWHAEFFGEMDPRLCYGDRHGRGDAEAPSLAICLAALRAVGVEP